MRSRFHSGSKIVLANRRNMMSMRGFLAEEVVDAEDLPLLEHTAQLRVERAGRVQVVAERLLDHHAGVRWCRLARASSSDDLAEQRRRYLQVEHRRVFAFDRRASLLVGLRVGEVTGDHRKSLCEAAKTSSSIFSPAVSIELRAWSTSRLRPVVECDADDRAVEQPAALQPVERPERHLLWPGRR